MPGLSNAPFSPILNAGPVYDTGVPNFNSFTTAPNPLNNAPVNQQLGVNGASGTVMQSRADSLTASQGSATTLVYPIDTPKYIITFSISLYDRSSLNEVGQFMDSGYPGIVLPLPTQLIDINSVNWHEQSLGLAQIAGAALSGGVAAVAGSAGQIGGALGQAAVTGAETAFGVVPNQFVTMMFRGPKFKRHPMSWSFSPNNFREADTLRGIIQVFKNAMAPNIYGNVPLIGPILWSFPKIFFIRMYPNSKFTYKFKPCVLENFSVNYTPGGRGSFLRNGSGTVGDNPPEGVTIQAQFIELEYWIEGNVTNSNDPSDVEATTPNQSASKIIKTVVDDTTALFNAGEDLIKSVGAAIGITTPGGDDR